jgi:HlyD family secretion protein
MAKKRKKKLKKRILQGIVAASLIGVIAWAVWPKAVVVETDDVRIGSFRAIVEAEGKTQARDKYSVWATIPGSVQTTSLNIGDPVVRDQPVDTLIPNAAAMQDPQTAQWLSARIAAADAARSQGVADREKAMAAIDAARSKLREAEQPTAGGTVSAGQQDQAQQAVKLAFAEMEAANNAVHRADYDLAAAQAGLARVKSGNARDSWVVRSPLDGIVLGVGQQRDVGVGASLVEIGNPKNLEVVLTLPSVTAAQVQVGQQVQLKTGGDEPLEGSVRRVEAVPPPAAAEGAVVDPSQQRSTVLVDFLSPPRKWQDLGDGHRVDVRIVTATLDNVIKVPVAALVADGAQRAVFVVVDGKARKRPVTVRAQGEFEAVVDQGVKEDEQVILHPDAKIRDGVRVKSR